MNKYIDKIKKVLSEDGRIIFAYLFGSAAGSGKFNDIDIAVYCTEHVLDNPFAFTSDLKIALSKGTGLSPVSILHAER